MTADKPTADAGAVCPCLCHEIGSPAHPGQKCRCKGGPGRDFADAGVRLSDAEAVLASLDLDHQQFATQGRSSLFGDAAQVIRDLLRASTAQDAEPRCSGCGHGVSWRCKGYTAQDAGAGEVGLRAAIEALADEWKRDLDSGAIRDPDARYCWQTAERELRAALGPAKGGA